MWINPQETVDLVTFTKEILHGQSHILCSEVYVAICFIRKYCVSRYDLYFIVSVSPEGLRYFKIWLNYIYIYIIYIYIYIYIYIALFLYEIFFQFTFQCTAKIFTLNGINQFFIFHSSLFQNSFLKRSFKSFQGLRIQNSCFYGTGYRKFFRPKSFITESDKYLILKNKALFSFLSVLVLQASTIHRKARKEVGCLFNSSLSLPTASQILRQQRAHFCTFCTFLRIWSYLLKKSFLENFIFVQCTWQDSRYASAILIIIVTSRVLFT